MFFCTDRNYISWVLSEQGICPSTQNVESVVDYPVPRNTKEVHQFVSLASYFRRFVPKFSVLAKPLYDLLRKDVPFTFGPREMEAFETLKRLLASQPIIAIYSPKLETELHCDASASGLDAILLQRQSDNNFDQYFILASERQW